MADDDHRPLLYDPYGRRIRGVLRRRENPKPPRQPWLAVLASRKFWLVVLANTLGSLLAILGADLATHWRIGLRRVRDACRRAIHEVVAVVERVIRGVEDVLRWLPSTVHGAAMLLVGLGIVVETSTYSSLLDRPKPATRPAADAEVPAVASPEPPAAVEAVVYFQADRAELDALGRSELERVALKLAANGRARIRVEGHADSRGESFGNEALGKERGQSIRQHLVSSGIEADRIAVITYGDRRPVCQPQTEACWALNRRAEVRLTP